MKRSKFSLSYTKLLSCDMGELVPIGLTEVLPGDSVQHATSLLVRVSPLLAPVMHPVRVRVHHWFVPNRIVWDGWEDFITGGPDNDNAAVAPFFGQPVLKGMPEDYYGIPPDIPQGQFERSALPMRGYNLIVNEWYRDQDLVNERAISLGDGADSVTDRTMFKVAWEKDYFTSARPWPQKGPDVTLPLGASAPVISNQQPIKLVGGGATDGNLQVNAISSELGALQLVGANVDDQSILFGSETGLLADLANATPPTINAIREAFALQRYAEARARYGSRYTEYLRYLGVKSSDARLQRPEYLGGGKQVIQFSEVLQTGPDDPANDQVVGSLKGHGIGAMRSNRYRRFFEEHGFIHSFVSVLPKTMYPQGIFRHWYRKKKEDYWQRELQHIGQQDVRVHEVYGLSATPEATFGWQDRYDEYRRSESGVAGDFRDTLNYWHYAREFASQPVLNGSFVTSDPTKRPNAVQSEDVLWIMVNHSIQARRLVAQTGRSFIY